MNGEGWYLSGDKGYRDEEGWFYFVDRKCNMIKRGGENVSATEVEDALLMHPAVAECAVIGVDDPVRDQAVKPLSCWCRDRRPPSRRSRASPLAA